MLQWYANVRMLRGIWPPQLLLTKEKPLLEVEK